MPGEIPAYTGLFIGLGLSTVANLSAASLDNADPTLIEYAMAGIAPLSVFVVIEILANTEWPGLTRWVAIRWLVSIFVGAGAAVVSFLHLFHLAMDDKPHTGSNLAIAILSPLMIDGLVSAGTAALLAIRSGSKTAPPQAHPQPVEKRQPEKQPERSVSRETGSNAERVATEAVVRPPKPGQKRFRREQHPLWSAFVAEGKTWDVERMRKELSTWSGTEVTPEAARQTLKRWMR